MAQQLSSDAVHIPFMKNHSFLGNRHVDSEARTWNVIYLCFISMVFEIVCGLKFGSMALVADGFHMGTHVSAFLITALAYNYAAKHADDPRYTFGTGTVSFICQH